MVKTGFRCNEGIYVKDYPSLLLQNYNMKQSLYLLRFLLCQGHDRYLWLMQGLFRANGGCGYVKKPDILLESGPHNEVFDQKRSLPVHKKLKVTFLYVYIYIFIYIS